MRSAPEIDAVLLLYHHHPVANAPTIMDHVEALQSDSRFPVFAVNTDDGFPPFLEALSFRAIVLHYSLFATAQYHLPPRGLDYLAAADSSYKIAFFQDEHHYCRQRFDFIDRYWVGAVYTLLEPVFHSTVYGRHRAVDTIRTTLPGYVSDDLIDQARRRFIPDHERAIDIGYRARRLPYYMGAGAQEKHQIAQQFLDRVSGANLRVDIRADESSRIYGDRWYRFVAQCRAMLGVEAGASVFDLDDSARERTAQLLAERPNLDFRAVADLVLEDYEGNVPYRTISPRHFEAAAFRVLPLLYEGRYSGILEPERHYVPVAKDLSNLDAVLHRFRDPSVRHDITERAYADLIASGRFSYRRFMSEFDEHLARVGVGDSLNPAQRQELDRRFARWRRRRRPAAAARNLRHRPFAGRESLARAYRRIRGGPPRSST